VLTLSPQARAVTAFALGFFLVSGELNRIGTALIATFDSNLGQDQLAAASAVTLLVGAAVLWFSRQAAQAVTETWSVALAQSASLLAVVGLVITLLTLVAALVQDGASAYYLGLG